MTWGFIAWTAFFVALLVLLAIAARRSRAVDQKTEALASTTLPEVGEIAVRKYHAKFGRAPTNLPKASGRPKVNSWYPETKARAKHHV